jgi:hypothetical protein
MAMRESTAPGRKKVALVCTVWGEKFVELFCEQCLPTLLAPANLPWASSVYDITFAIYTKTADIARVCAHENFKEVSQCATIKFVALEDLPARATTGHWIQWQHAISSLHDFWAFVLIIPDCVYANSLLSKVLHCLASNDFVYYSLPQVCLEQIVPRLRELRGARNGGGSTLDLSERQIVELFIDYINPKHAAAVYKPDYFMTHPEYALTVTQGRLQLTELSCHPLAISGKAKSLSYTFNPSTTGASLGFLEILGISCEFTLKFIEQYFRWPSERMDLSRCANLAAWYYTFWEEGSAEYANTKTDIRVSNPPISQMRAPLTKSRLTYLNAVGSYHAVFYAIHIHSMLNRNCKREVRRFIALTIHAPGFRKAIMRKHTPLTVLLPIGDEPVKVLRSLYDLRNRAALIKFVLLHIVAGKILLKSGQEFVLNSSEQKDSGELRLQTVDPTLKTVLSASVTGTISSEPVYASQDVVVYETKMKYGSAAIFD